MLHWQLLILERFEVDTPQPHPNLSVEPHFRHMTWSQYTGDRGRATNTAGTGRRTRILTLASRSSGAHILLLLSIPDWHALCISSHQPREEIVFNSSRAIRKTTPRQHYKLVLNGKTAVGESICIMSFLFLQLSGNGSAHLAMHKLGLNWDDCWIAGMCLYDLKWITLNITINMATGRQKYE